MSTMVFQSLFSIPLKACITGNSHFHLSSVTRSSFPFPIKVVKFLSWERRRKALVLFISKKRCGAIEWNSDIVWKSNSLYSHLIGECQEVFWSGEKSKFLKEEFLSSFSIQSYTLCRATPCTLFSLSCLASCCQFWKGSRRERRSTFIKRCESIHSGKNESRQRQKRGKQEAKAIVLFWKIGPRLWDTIQLLFS